MCTRPSPLARASVWIVLLSSPVALLAAPTGSPDPAPGVDAQSRSGQARTKSKSKTKTKYTDEQLKNYLEWNSAEIFGGQAKVDGDRITITFDRKGQITRGFAGKGVHDSDSDDIQGSNRKFIKHGDQKGGEKLYPKLAAIGLGSGRWVSRFPIAGDTRLEFGFRLPNLIGGSSTFSAIINFNPKRKSGYETQFFNQISLLSSGRRTTTRRTSIKKYQGHARHWFPRKGDSTRVKFSIEDGKCIVNALGKDTVEVPLKKDRGGHVSFAFNKIVFTLDDIVVAGLLDREWCEKELGRLAKAEALVTTEPVKEEEVGEEGEETGEEGEETGEEEDADDEADDPL